jgi:hypothetical protein
MSVVGRDCSAQLVAVIGDQGTKSEQGATTLIETRHRIAKAGLALRRQ